MRVRKQGVCWNTSGEYEGENELGSEDGEELIGLKNIFNKKEE